jgi:hypothetical protein
VRHDATGISPCLPQRYTKRQVSPYLHQETG